MSLHAYADVQALDTRTFEIGGVILRVRISSSLLDAVEEAFGDLLLSHASEPAVTLEAISGCDRVGLWRDGLLTGSCRTDEFLPVFKAELIESVIRAAHYEVALHAGAFTRGDSALLLLGSPGAGKTTLGMALAASGFDLLADDVVLLHADESISGLPFAPAVKSGAWDLVAPYWPRLARSPIHMRPDGQCLRYANGRLSKKPGRKCRIGYVALLDRRPHASAVCAEADPVNVLQALVSEAAARTELLTAKGFAALAATLADARCCTLTYSDLSEATLRLREFCR